MSIRDYENSVEWKGFLADWIENRRLALPVVDLFFELGEEGLAEACRWIATHEERKPYITDERLQWFRTGHFPCYDSVSGDYYWFRAGPFDLYADCLNVALYSLVVGKATSARHKNHFATVEDALLALVDGVAGWLSPERAVSRAKG